MGKPKSALLLGIIILATGCAKAPKASDVQSGGAVEKLLASVTVSQKLTSDPERLKKCEAEKVIADFDAVKLPETDAPALWNSCQSLYACSASAKELMEELFESGATFQLGFTDLAALNVSSVKDKARALYVANTGKIFIDTRVKSMPLACSLLLHELVHRFDPMANGTSESLNAEYRAYWHQESFNEDIYLRGDKFAVAFKRLARRTTKEQLLEDIATLYGFEIDRTLLDRFGPLPFEVTATDF